MNQSLFILIALLLFAIFAVGTTDVVLRQWPASAPLTAGGGQVATTTPEGPATFTLAEVATHASRASCYATINGSVYDLTTWIDRHPGGPARILGICGKDGSTMFEGQHEENAKAQAMLATFKIGTLAP